MTLWLTAVMPIVLLRRSERQDGLGTLRRLAGSGRPLHRQHAAIKLIR